MIEGDNSEDKQNGLTSINPESSEIIGVNAKKKSITLSNSRQQDSSFYKALFLIVFNFRTCEVLSAKTSAFSILRLKMCLSLPYRKPPPFSNIGSCQDIHLSQVNASFPLHWYSVKIIIHQHFVKPCKPLSHLQHKCSKKYSLF